MAVFCVMGLIVLFYFDFGGKEDLGHAVGGTGGDLEMAMTQLDWLVVLFNV